MLCCRVGYKKSAVDQDLHTLHAQIDTAVTRIWDGIAADYPGNTLDPSSLDTLAEHNVTVGEAEQYAGSVRSSQDGSKLTTSMIRNTQNGCHGWTTHTQRVLVVFNKFDTGGSLVLSGGREEVYGRRAKPCSTGYLPVLRSQEARP
jgi:hypothetical protein